MSWKEAEEAFQETDTVILPVGTLHGHGPTPISIDSSSVEKIALEVGEKTGIVTLPLIPYGENEKQKFYPGSIAINPTILEEFYFEVFKSLVRNGIKKVILFNGHGGNREVLIRAGGRARELGLIIAILEWWSLSRKLCPELYPEKKGSFMSELAVAVAIGGKEIADIRPGKGYKGEWGEKYTMKNLFGKEIAPQGFHNFEYKGGGVIIPIEAWDLDLEGPPILEKNILDDLKTRGEKTIDCVVNYSVDFVNTFKKIDVSQALNSHD
jgi:hypothetical protein